jgi:AcrR family transcriptional regulator
MLRTTLELAAEAGYAGLTLEAVARRARVSKHTIYRRWPSKATLLLDALGYVWTTDLDYGDSGDVRADLREQFVRSSNALSKPPIGPVYRAVIAEAQSDPDQRAELHRRFLSNVEERTLARVTRAQHTGELNPDVDLTFAAEVLCGALYYRHLVTARPVDASAVDSLLDMFMAAYATRRDSGQAEARQE